MGGKQIEGDNFVDHIVVQETTALRKQTKDSIFFSLEPFAQFLQGNNRILGDIAEDNRNRPAMSAGIVSISSSASLGNDGIPDFRRDPVFVCQRP